MNGIGYKKYSIRLKALSPVFIGGGEDSKVSRLEYVYSRNSKKIYLLDSGKWVRFLSETRLLDDYVENARRVASGSRGGIDNYEYLSSRIRVHKRDVEAVLEEVSYQTLSTGKNPEFRTHDIYLFLRNAEYLPYIPGSSIKGALETALLSYFCSAKTGIRERYGSRVFGLLNDNNMKPQQKKKGLGRTAKQIEEEAFDWETERNQKRIKIKGMSGLSVSDSKPFSSSRLYLDKKRDLVIKDGIEKESGRIPFYREYAEPGTETEFTLTLYPDRLKKELGITDIIDIIKAMEARWNLLFGDNGFFKAWPSVEKYFPLEAVKENRGLIILGGGAGYHSKTVITAISRNMRDANELTKRILDVNYKNKKHFRDTPLSPRALKVAEYNGRKQIIGICRIEVLQ
ncbi:hypothetical protein H0A61_00925 [Koleobacter methoxysyntrophicus]|uniref:CRISPR system Cms protein Csm5 n=1 Tax=Koleobacter methoxysyntrophicus TaxID=2751313 RepID=A0A8A0RL21_9FIRM|nr:type III-A CRISPR-associated RAMP protein Csm5 [Koleobacter methoxysyntrophicus]QSQ08592.1 hypothetical protein H0A61_00925 [Koleobacter methoxysyntrophicus]